MFDPDDFFSSEVEGEISDKRQLVPANTYAGGTIKDVKVQHGVIKDGERAGDPWAMLNIQWSIQDENLRKELDRSEVVVTQSLFMDLTPAGKLDTGKGKNYRLGKLLSSLNINRSGFAPAKLIGAYAKAITISHRVDKDGEPREEVSGVAG